MSENILTPESIKIWEDALIATYEANGWKIIQNDEDSLCFSLLEDEEHEWLHDWRRKQKHWVKMNARQKINLKSNQL